MRFDNHLSGNIAAFLLKLKEQLHTTDRGYNSWVALNYPTNQCVAMQQRQRVLGMAIGIYIAIVRRVPTEAEKLRVLEWVRRNPFVVVDEHVAMQLFIRLHSDVPVNQTMVTIAPRNCCKFSYPLVTPELVGK